MISFDFARGLMSQIGIDGEGREFFGKMADDILAGPNAELAELIVAKLVSGDWDGKNLNALCDTLAELSGYSENAVTGFVFLAGTEKLHAKFAERGISEQIFVDTMDDFRCKLLECRQMHHENGIFVRDWELSFYKMERFALGRLQFELAHWWNPPSVVAGRLISNGQRTINFHIPASGKPFTAEARADAYRQALEFFADDFDSEYIPIVCSSWLLDPKHQACLPEKSNIRHFADDFDVVIGRSDEKFNDAWRIFYDKATLPPEELPENSSLERAYKKRLVEHDRFCHGQGLKWYANPRFAK